MTSRSAFDPIRLPSGSFVSQPRVEQTEVRFVAMGTWCHIIVVGGDPSLLVDGELQVRELERVWTRFDPTSELSQLNERAGHVVQVSAEMAILVQRSIRGFALTGGLFDPFLGREIVEAGYDRDFSELAAPSPANAPSNVEHRVLTMDGKFHFAGGRVSTRRAPARIDMTKRLVRLEPGAHLDSGGLGKGLGADLVSEYLMSHGAAGALVNLGGDLRVRGAYPSGGWQIGIDNPRDESGPPSATVNLTGGGLCTSTSLRRRWQDADGNNAHHVLDPRTGRPAHITADAVTAIAPAGWLAEVWSKTVLIAGQRRGARLLRRSPRCAALVFAADGSFVQLP